MKTARFLILVVGLAAGLQASIFAQATNETVTAPGKPEKLTLEDFDYLLRDVFATEEDQLNLNTPRYQKGDEIKLKCWDGVNEVGIYEWASSNKVIIVKSSNEAVVMFSKLSAEDRLRCDFQFRKDFVEMQSRYLVRKMLVDYWNENEEKPKEKIEEIAGKLAYGDPDAMMEGGLSYLQRSPGFDPAYAYMYFYILANDGDGEAQYNLGQLYLRGIGVQKDMAKGLQWTASASEAGWNEARMFLDKYKVSMQARQQAAEQYAARLRENQALFKQSQQAFNRYKEQSYYERTGRLQRSLGGVNTGGASLGSSRKKLGDVIRKTEVNVRRNRSNRDRYNRYR